MWEFGLVRSLINYLRTWLSLRFLTYKMEIINLLLSWVSNTRMHEKDMGGGVWHSIGAEYTASFSFFLLLLFLPQLAGCLQGTVSSLLSRNPFPLLAEERKLGPMSVHLSGGALTKLHPPLPYWPSLHCSRFFTFGLVWGKHLDMSLNIPCCTWTCYVATATTAHRELCSGGCWQARRG